MYRILINRASTDRNGNDRRFVQIEVTTDNDVFSHAEWLSPSEVAAVAADATAIEGIAAAMATRATLKRPKQLEDEARAHELELARLQAGINV